LAADERVPRVDWENTTYTGQGADEQFMTWLASFSDFGYHYAPHLEIRELGFDHYGIVDQRGVFELVQGSVPEKPPFLYPFVPGSDWHWETASVETEQFGAVSANVTRMVFTPRSVPAGPDYKAYRYDVAFADFGDFWVITDCTIELTGVDSDDTRYIRVKLVSAAAR
jgi:hypothetical protein